MLALRVSVTARVGYALTGSFTCPKLETEVQVSHQILFKKSNKKKETKETGLQVARANLDGPTIKG